MTEREFLKSEVLNLLSEKLVPFGYKLSKSACEFTKKTEFGWSKYQVVFLIRDKGWEIKPSLLIRFDVVEDLYHQISDFEKKYQKLTPTIGTALEDLNHNVTGSRFELKEINQIGSVVEALFDLFESQALPYFLKYKNLQEIDNILNNNINDTSMTGDIFKGIKSLIIAKLLNRSDFIELQKAYYSYYEKFSNGFYLPEYIRLIDLLNSHV